MTILFIDTSSNERIKISLTINEQEVVYEETMGERKSQGVLPLIQKGLQEQSIRFSDLTAIKVHCGPGSYTGLRVGVAVANTLATVLQIPLNDQPLGKTVEPIYS